MTNQIQNIDITKLQKIAVGYEYTVYALSDEKVLKVSNGRHFHNSGKVLEELSDLPFIPKVYEYGDDWLIMQRIQGNTIFSYSKGISWFRVKFDYFCYKSDVKRFYEGCRKIGWIPNDLNPTNLMIDVEGDFWIVDVGFFKKADEVDFLFNYYETLLSYGQAINDVYDRIEFFINYVGEEKIYAALHPYYVST